ncbi:ATPase V1 complex subunit C [Russula aff. rugulosa BPL654]|nr:ATPase V1 complex subunit C [Russula aff. rugulosa BPL654]
MPSDQSTWIISVPQDGDSEGLLEELGSKFSQQSKAFTPNNIGQLPIPSFKTGTLDSLIALSEELPKYDANFTSVVAKIVETLRNLLNNDPSKLAQHILINYKSVDEYLLNHWHWNEGRYGTQRGLKDMTDVLVKEITSIDNMMKSKLNNYNLAKGSLVQLQRKKTGNLSVRSLADIVSEDDLLQDSEYMQSILVAVPKTLVKTWNSSYEHLATMVVPRSAVSLASDDDYTLFTVIIFRKVYDAFVQKCRENKYVVRDFRYSSDQIDKEREELQTADTAEKELWTELLRLSEINFSEAFQAFVHLKVVRLYVESVLRYGLPANYIGIAVKPEPKTTKRTLMVLQRQFSYLSARSQGPAKVKGGVSANEDFVGEYQSLLDQEFFDFVLYEIPWVVS